MEFKDKKLPFLSLENQYTYLKRKQGQKKTNALQELSEQLKGYKKLPSIDKKYINTTRKVQKQILQLQLALKARSQNRQPLSQHRYCRQNILPIYIPMALSMPIRYELTPIAPQNRSQVITPKIEPPQVPQTQPKEQQKPEQIQKEEMLKKPKQINQFPQKSKLNKFRIYAYAVYFAIYFKYFSRKYTELRRNWFNQRYAINDGKIIFQGSAKILRHLYEIDIYKMLQTSKQRVKQMDLEQLNIQKASKSKGKGSDSVLIMMQFITLLLDYVREYMTGKAFIRQHHEVFTVGVLTQNFMLTNLYLPQQAALLHIHQKGYILVDEETQIMLLMIKIIIKILVYNYLLSLKFSRQWNAKQEKSYGLDDSEMQEIWTITRQAGIFLTIVCEQIYQKTYKQMGESSYKKNFAQLSPKFNIFPAKSLQQLKISKSIPNPNDSSSKLIINLQGYSDVLTLINLNPTLFKFREKVKLKIIDFLTIVYTQLKYQQAIVYDFVKYMTLDEKYLILKGRKEDLLKKQSKNKKKKKKGKNGKKKNQKGAGKGNRKGMGGENGENGENGEDQDEDQSDNDGNFDERGKNNENNGEDGQSGSQDEEDSDQEGKRKKRKLRYRHEQAFFDHKFDGHHKLLKLKKKMAKNEK